MTKAQFVEILRQWLLPAALGFAGGLSTFFWRRVDQRRATVKIAVEHSALASSIDSPVFGKIAVLLNEHRVDGGLHSCAVHIENESSRDLTDVSLFLSYTDQNNYFAGGPFTTGTAHQIKNSQHYEVLMAEWRALENKQEPRGLQLMAFLTRNQQLTIPLLARWSKVTFSFLVISGHGRPDLDASIEHPGVLVRRSDSDPGPQVLGVSRLHASLIGSAIGVPALLWLAGGWPWSDWPLFWRVYLASFVGSSSVFGGALIYRFVLLIRRTLFS